MVLVKHLFIFSWLSLILEETKNNLRYFLFQKIDKWCFKRLGDKTVWRRKEKEQIIFESILFFAWYQHKNNYFCSLNIFFTFFNTILKAFYMNSVLILRCLPILEVIWRYLSNYYFRNRTFYIIFFINPFLIHKEIS